MTDLPEPHYYQTTEADGRCTFNPYYTATQMREYRNQALEDAAKLFEPAVTPADAARAAAIRALKEQK